LELKAGAMVNERLRLVRAIGQGGMGAVWVAYHEALKAEVAVKFVTGQAKENDKMLARFAREASIAAKLKSPHVAQTYDHGLCTDGTPYIVMELLEGESLHKRLSRGALSLHETRLVVGQAAQALGKAHKLGIIHRDVKPANLFLVDTEYELFVKLLDFGIAKLSVATSEAELTDTGSVMGSLLYMSPEQLTAIKDVDERADLWALAVVAYRCLATAPPFTGDALGNVMMAVMQQDYRPISTLRPELPLELDDWFARAFHTDIDERFQSARQMAKSLLAITDNEPGDDASAELLPVRLSVAEEEPQSEPEPDSEPDSEPTAKPVKSVWAARSNSDDEVTLTPAARTVRAGGGKRRNGLLAGAALLLAVGVGVYVGSGTRERAVDAPDSSPANGVSAAAAAESSVGRPMGSAPTSPARIREASARPGSSASAPRRSEVVPPAPASAADAHSAPITTPWGPAPPKGDIDRRYPVPPAAPDDDIYKLGQ
jgi:serine/threonine-protein kinase